MNTTCTGANTANIDAAATAATPLLHGRQVCSHCGRAYFLTKTGTLPKHKG